MLSFVRGLGRVAEKRECEYRDMAGQRRTRTEYFVPDRAATIVDLAEDHRRRA